MESEGSMKIFLLKIFNTLIKVMKNGFLFRKKTIIV